MISMWLSTTESFPTCIGNLIGNRDGTKEKSDIFSLSSWGVDGCIQLFVTKTKHIAHLNMPVSATSGVRSSKTTTAPSRTRAASASTSKPARNNAANASSSIPSSSHVRSAVPTRRTKNADGEIDEATTQLDIMTIKDMPRTGSIAGKQRATKKTAQTTRPTTPTADDLAHDIATRLKLDPSSSKSNSQSNGNPSGTSDENITATKALQCLRTVSQTLSDAVQLEWRASVPTKHFTIKSLRSSVINAHTYISILRDSALGRPVDIERTVIHMCGRLVTLELVRILAQISLTFPLTIPVSD